ncbi:MAG TPA: hypothetical protein VHN98_00465 [Acidimicrobiales bacterium]|nr:hypothetical protein [Acidimicrobiales bacterium]
MAGVDVAAPPFGRVHRGLRVARIALGLVALASLELGAWALAAPRSFYDSFPGGGRTWVSIDGPFNEHLVRDVGALSLALVVVLVVAVWSGDRAQLRIGAAAAIVWGLPHLAYHLAHLTHLSTSDRAGEAVSLALGVALPVAALVATRRTAVAST